MSFEYSKLPHQYPRRFVPKNVDLVDPVKLRELFGDLQKRPLGSRGDLERWLEDESELASAIAEEQTLRYIRMTCQTDDEARERAYLDFVERAEPEVKLGLFELDKKYLATRSRKELPHDKYFVLDRRRENSAALFREQNVELEKEETKLGQKYQKITGATTVMYEGSEKTMPQMARYLEETDRGVRQKTWIMAEERRLRDRDTLDELYDYLLDLRGKIAKNAGFDNYRDYIFKKLARFDYTPENCFQYHDAIEKHIVPLMRAIDEERAEKVGESPLRPWDLLVDPEGKPPLRPFKTATELVEGCRKIFARMHADFARDFGRMAELSLLDLESRKGKAPGGYNSELMEVRFPFIFMNGVGRDADLRTILHESGHAFHVFATRNSNLHFLYRGEGVPTEFSEVASQAMELMAGEHLDGTFYDREGAKRSMHEHLVDTVKLLAWVATIDAFQHWVYTHPGHSREERGEFWVKLRERFGGLESYDGYEDIWRSRWQRQLHLYLVPFYYIEYGIAMLGALGIWTRYRKDRKGAIESYRRSLTLGGSRPLPELFKTAGVPFDFGPGTVEPYTRELASILKT